MAGLRVTKVRVELDSTWVYAVGVSMAAPRVNETTQAVMTRSMVLTPVRTGNLRSRHRKVMRARRTSVTGTVENRTKYAIYVHEGTKAHLIVARKKKALRWTEDGLVFFRRVVRHPGTKGRPFMRTALFEEAPRRGFLVTGGARGTLIRQVFDG